MYRRSAELGVRHGEEVKSYKDDNNPIDVELLQILWRRIIITYSTNKLLTLARLRVLEYILPTLDYEYLNIHSLSRDPSSLLHFPSFLLTLSDWLLSYYHGHINPIIFPHAWITVFFPPLLLLSYYTIISYPTLLYSTLLYSTLLYSTLLYSTLLYSTLLYSTLPARP